MIGRGTWMKKTLGKQLYACGNDPFPEAIDFEEKQFHFERVFKHDFFAATILYQQKDSHASSPDRIVLKLARSQHLLGMPMRWLGEWLTQHEVAILKKIQNLSGAPKLLDTFGSTGFFYEFIEGANLDNSKDIPEDFFDELTVFLRKIHERNIVYLDMNKRSNIILDPKGRPHIIDFQISRHIHANFLIWPSVTARLLNFFQRADFYHLLKHKRRLAPHLLTPEEETLLRHKSRLLTLHRKVVTPLRQLRRNFLKYLHVNGFLKDNSDTHRKDEGYIAKLSK
jgi:serine/threonine protein kinase